ncbi:hypothetical protein [Leucobacter tenebrionis]|uniref:hypothetical protein n=1 Tax=Leucobacter tenebrionis TaxID=2873270 RepID=UPI001CA6E009|nr:hypothetical protein [Leucobacter tenebrionis]QZY51730.1 hypothetical protein KVY00_14400 [Leucobacter tenebrionis]
MRRERFSVLRYERFSVLRYERFSVLLRERSESQYPLRRCAAAPLLPLLPSY